MTLIISQPKMQSIWASVESYCLCRDFGYPQYLEVITQHSKASPVSEEMYAALGCVFFDEMARSYDEYSSVRGVTDQHKNFLNS